MLYDTPKYDSPNYENTNKNTPEEVYTFQEYAPAFDCYDKIDFDRLTKIRFGDIEKLQLDIWMQCYGGLDSGCLADIALEIKNKFGIMPTVYISPRMAIDIRFNVYSIRIFLDLVWLGCSVKLANIDDPKAIIFSVGQLSLKNIVGYHQIM